MDLYDRADREIEMIEHDESLTDREKGEQIREVEKEVRIAERYDDEEW